MDRLNHWIIMGPPGSGKGTQADRLVRELGMVYIGTGMMLKNLSPADAKEAEEVRRSQGGAFASDALVNRLVRKRLNDPDVLKHGFFLDGYPRTVSQAEYLDTITLVRGCLVLEIPDEKIIDRILPRRECSYCKRPYHLVYNPSKSPLGPDHCESEGCAGLLIQRPDDTVEILGRRLKDYRRVTYPVVDYYDRHEERSCVIRIDADRPIDVVTADLLDATRGKMLGR